jgi:hypothetical protein
MSNLVHTEKLTMICKKIEIMPQFNQIEILRIISKHKDIILNENKNGIHINLTEVDNIIIEELLAYINYINTQELNLNEIESQKEQFKNIYFTKDNKDNNTNNLKHASTTSS